MYDKRTKKAELNTLLFAELMSRIAFSIHLSNGVGTDELMEWMKFIKDGALTGGSSSSDFSMYKNRLKKQSSFS